VEFHPSPAGMWEHGEKLRDLMRLHGQDFGDPADFPLARPDPKWFDASGRYHARERDQWGTVWEFLVFGIAGHPVERPLDDWNGWGDWRTPPAAASEGCEFEAARRKAMAHRERYFLKDGWISVFEVMHAVRRFEDVLADLATDGSEINRLADAIVEHRLREIRYLLERGVDAIQFADDFGTQTGLMISPGTWRRFFRPRYARMLEPVRAAGVRAFFHSCGMVRDLLEDFASLGFAAVWPQAPLYDARELARTCRSLGMAVAIHPDRAHLMTRGTPEKIREAVLRLADDFRSGEGGSWFYVEIDNGFPWVNISSLVSTVGELRTWH